MELRGGEGGKRKYVNKKEKEDRRCEGAPSTVRPERTGDSFSFVLSISLRSVTARACLKSKPQSTLDRPDANHAKDVLRAEKQMERAFKKKKRGKKKPAVQKGPPDLQRNHSRPTQAGNSAGIVHHWLVLHFPNLPPFSCNTKPSWVKYAFSAFYIIRFFLSQFTNCC